MRTFASRTTITATALATALTLTSCSEDEITPAPSPDAVDTPSPPGGTSGEDVIAEFDRLDDRGRVFSGITNVGDDRFDAAVCEYLFGTPAEVAEYAGLDSGVVLIEGSGERSAGGGGSGYLCGWGVDPGADPDFGLQLWVGGDEADPDENLLYDEPVESDVDGELVGRAWKSPAAPDVALDTDDLGLWLNGAAERVGQSSV